MIKRDSISPFFVEVYSEHPKKIYETSKIIYNHIGEIWSIALSDMNDYKVSNNKGYR